MCSSHGYSCSVFCRIMVAFTVTVSNHWELLLPSGVNDTSKSCHAIHQNLISKSLLRWNHSAMKKKCQFFSPLNCWLRSLINFNLFVSFYLINAIEWFFSASIASSRFYKSNFIFISQTRQFLSILHILSNFLVLFSLSNCSFCPILSIFLQFCPLF